MGPRLSEVAARPKAESLARSWPTFLCTTRLISGWRGYILTSHGVGMRMTGWCTVVLSKKPKLSRPRFRLGWRSATWRCIRRKPGSLTAKTESGKANTRTSSLTFSGIAFGLVWCDVSEITPCLEDSIQQSAPRRCKLCEDSGLEPQMSDTAVLAGHSPAAQSSPSGVACVLWALCSLGAVSLATLRQSDARGVGDA